MSGLKQSESALFQRYRDWARTNVWLVPTALCVGAVLLGPLMLYLDRVCGSCSAFLPYPPMEVGAARQLMGVLITSVLSVGGVSFSVTMVALTLTSGQYGPKVLRHFLEDTRSKVSLGLFFATALYGLVVSVSMRPQDHLSLSVSVALLLAVIAFIEFIGFIHRTASDLQADQLIQRLGRQLRRDMRRLARADQDESREVRTSPWRAVARGKVCRTVFAAQEGYVQTVDYPEMARVLAAVDGAASIRVRPGGFLVPGAEILRAWLPADGPAEDVASELRTHVTVGPIRTPIQDPEFPITQIQQIAARALSTGINDPGTAITCIDWLTLALAEVVDAPLPTATIVDDAGTARLLVRPLSFASLINAVYSPLRQFTSQDLPVCLRLFESLNTLADGTRRRERLSLLHEQGARVWRQVCDEEHPDYDLAPLKLSYRQLHRRTVGRARDS